MSIPASNLANVVPGVVGVGGSAVALLGMMLTTNAAVPINAPMSFANALAVSTFFGPTSDEFSLASIYFNGFDNSTQKPGALLFAQYPTAAVSGYLRSASLASMTLAQLQAIPAGTMTVVVDGVSKTSNSINLSTATSFSNAATIISAAFSTGPAFTFDAQRAAFVATSGTTGASSSVSFASGTVATALSLTQATGAVVSAGAVAATPAAFMANIVTKATNFATFMSVFEPVTADKLAFSAWTDQQGQRYAYCAWDTDVTATQTGNTTSFGPQLVAAGYSGTIAHTADINVANQLGTTMQALARPLAAQAMGYAASLDFNRQGGRTTYAFRGQGSLVAGVQDASVAANLRTNGYNFYGAYATSSQIFQFMQPGIVSGRFAYADSYFNQIWLNSGFQQALLAFLAQSGSIPYNQDGYAAIETVLSPQINAALRYGAIRSGVTLSGSQTASADSSAGKSIAPTLSTRGWYLGITDPGAAARVARTSPVMTFYYCDGGSIQQLTLASLLVQ